MPETNIELSPVGKKRSLVVGVNGCSVNLPGLPPLLHAVGDTEGISWHLRQGEFESSQGGDLFESAASTQNVRRTVNELIRKSAPEDLLLFYFIGCIYALPTNAGNKTYLVTADFDPDDVADEPGAHLSLDWIHTTFFTSKSQCDVMVILDCCSAEDAQVPLSPDKHVIQQIDMLLDDLDRSRKAMKPSHAYSTRMQAIIVSTETHTLAYEGNGHTSMTHLILNIVRGKDQKALSPNGDITLFNLYKYLQGHLQEKQNPIMKGSFSTDHHWALLPVMTGPFSSRTPDPPETASRSIIPSVQHLFDETLCQEATDANLDMDQVRPFLRRPRIFGQDEYHANYNEQQQMEAFDLLRNDHPSYGALLCFGHRPSHQIVGAYTRCIYWRDSKRLSGWLDEREFRGSLLEQFALAHNFLIQHLGNQISDGDKPEPGKIDLRVLDEALANALIHREYVTEPDRLPRTEGVMVEIFRDRIEILSPGGPPLNIEVLQRAAEQHPTSRPRNPQIMRIFYLAGHVERAGTGITRMMTWMQDAGLPKPEIGLNEQTQTFSITLHRSAITLSEPSPQVINSHAQPLPGAKQVIHRATLPFVKNIALGGSFQTPYLITVLSTVLIVALVFGLGVGAFTVFPQWYIATIVPPTTTIEIASDFPTSGQDRTIGLPVQDGVQMAIDDTNNNNLLPGYTLKLTPYDDVGRGNRHDPLKGVSNLKTAIAENLVAGVIGPYNSTVAEAELPIANQAAIALISPSNTYPCLTKDVNADPDCSGSSNIEAQMRPTGQLTYFRLSTTDDLEGKAAAQFFFTAQHYHNVLLLEDDSDVYSLGLAQTFQHEWTQLGGVFTPLGLPENASSVQDYQRTLQIAASLHPDLIYFAGNDPNGTYVLEALSNIPQLKSIAFAGASGIMDSSFQQKVAQLHHSAPIYVSAPTEDPAHSGQAVGIDFESNYTASGNSDYRPYAASAYDCTKVLILAIKTVLRQKEVSPPRGGQDETGAKRFRLAILQALTSIRFSYTGATGTHSFDANGDTTNHIISFYQLNFSSTAASWTWLKQISA